MVLQAVRIGLATEDHLVSQVDELGGGKVVDK